MTVEINYAIPIATLSDWLKNFAPVFQPMRNKTKTNRTLCGRLFPRREQATGNCEEFLLVHRAVCSCGIGLSTMISKPLHCKRALTKAGTFEADSRNRQ